MVIHRIPIVVATNSSRLPNAEFQSSADRIPPTPAMLATEIAETNENRASIGCPTAKLHCSIAHAAAAKAKRAAVVWMKSGSVNSGP